MKRPCSACRGFRSAPKGYKTCAVCRARVKRYTEANRDEINAHKRLLWAVGLRDPKSHPKTGSMREGQQ